MLFKLSLAKEKQNYIIDAFDLTSRYLDDLLNIDNIKFDQIVRRIYPADLQLNIAIFSDTEAPFLELNFSIRYSFYKKYKMNGIILVLI